MRRNEATQETEAKVQFDPAAGFYEMVNQMPARFFEIYNELVARGCSHRTADKAAREIYEKEQQA